MEHIKLISFLALLLSSGCVLRTNLIDSEIINSQQVYQDINIKVQAKELKQFTVVQNPCKPYDDGVRLLFRDKSKSIRYYKLIIRSDYSEFEESFYYDEGKVLRYVFIVGKYENMPSMTHTIMFNKMGERIFEDQKLVGPGTKRFVQMWPNEELVFNPEKPFYPSTPCW